MDSLTIECRTNRRNTVTLGKCRNLNQLHCEFFREGQFVRFQEQLCSCAISTVHSDRCEYQFHCKSCHRRDRLQSSAKLNTMKSHMIANQSANTFWKMPFLTGRWNFTFDTILFEIIYAHDLLQLSLLTFDWYTVDLQIIKKKLRLTLRFFTVISLFSKARVRHNTIGSPESKYRHQGIQNTYAQFEFDVRRLPFVLLAVDYHQSAS